MICGESIQLWDEYLCRFRRWKSLVGALKQGRREIRRLKGKKKTNEGSFRRWKHGPLKEEEER